MRSGPGKFYLKLLIYEKEKLIHLIGTFDRDGHPRYPFCIAP